jgi:integrase
MEARLDLPEDARKLLLDLRVSSRFSLDEHPVFASREGTPFGHRNVTRRGFEPARDLAGLDVSFHNLRHAAASRLIQEGHSDAYVADQLGHEDTTITRRVYVHVFDRQEQAKARKAIGQ